jgi:phospholipid/cholesterol/gamma-HCH transport system substrate-binding protein
VRPRSVDTLVGLFVVLGVVCLGWLSIRLGKLEVRGGRGYAVHATFSSISGLTTGAAVEIAGVEIGRVQRIELRDYRARVTLRIDPSVQLPDDAIASVKTRGLIGDRYVAITPGASERRVPPGGTIHDTEDAIDVEQLIAQFIHGKL